MGPEFLGAGLVFFQRFLLRVGLAGPRDNDDRCDRKNRSIESRFHRVTPYAAWRPRMLFILTGFRETNFGGSACELGQTLKRYHIRRRREASAARLCQAKNKLRR